MSIYSFEATPEQHVKRTIERVEALCEQEGQSEDDKLHHIYCGWRDLRKMEKEYGYESRSISNSFSKHFNSCTVCGGFFHQPVNKNGICLDCKQRLSE